MTMSKWAMVASVAVLYALDTILMVAFWTHESNPVLLNMGLGGALLLKGTVLALFGVGAYLFWDTLDHYAVRGGLLGVTALYALAFVTNLGVVLA